MSSSLPDPDSYLRVRFAHNLRVVRMRRGISQEQLAERAGFHRTYVSQVERAVQNISLDNVEKLARVLEVDAGELLNPMES